MIELRPYLDDDEAAVLTLWWDAWHSTRPGLTHPRPFSDWRERWFEQVLPANVVVVASRAGAVVGFAAASVEARELTQIFVSPSQQRAGVGRVLLDWARARMPEGFSLRTQTDNAVARAFYEKHGFAVGPTQTNLFSGMDTVEYRWAPSEASSEVMT